MSVLLTVSQNRFLLNSLHGDGFLNMRLTDQEAQEAVGIDPVDRVFTPCIQSAPCVLELRSRRPVPLCWASRHLPAGRVEAVGSLDAGAGGTAAVRRSAGEPDRGDRLPAGYGAAVALHRPAVSEDGEAPGTFGFLLGDTANAIHFWPGRGLNSGLASVDLAGAVPGGGLAGTRCGMLTSCATKR